MSAKFYRPENAQKRAKEFLDVGKPSRALDVLYEVIRKGKLRNNTSEKVLEPIMLMYLKLSVDLKKSHLAKEGLYQYRNIFQTVNVSTLEKVVCNYLHMAEVRTEAAQKESHEAVTTSVDDLDTPMTPEELLLRAVSGEDAQDRSDRTILTPWVKFLWESYRQCLELLRNNNLVEKLYHEIAKRAFYFCERYQRKTEFRKLCDNLLNHLQHLQKPPTSARAVSLSNADTQQMNLETRLEQLNFAIKMELWQEAYRAIEYVSDLMGKSKKSPKPQIMSSYYSKISLVFWKAGNELFHAASLVKLFQLNKDQKKNITQEEVTKRASIVLAATLAIPLPSSHPEFDRFIETEKSALEKIARLTGLLNLSKTPTRAGLFKELARCGVFAAVPPQLLSLYNLLEKDFEPLTLCKSMDEKLQWVSEQPDLEQYVGAIKEMTVTRLIKQLAQIYTTVSFDWLLKTAHFMDKFELERILVNLVRYNDQQIRIDHMNACVHFGSDASECQREDLPEGPTLQSMPSERIRCQLVHMNNAINECLSFIAPDAKKNEMSGIRNQFISVYNQSKVKDHNKILQRQFTIEVRKEKLEHQTIEREESIRKAQEELLQKQREEEQERLKREATEREKQRQEEQLKQIQTKQIKDKLLQISQTSYGQKMMEKFNEEELLSLDADEIIQRQVEELEKERKELQQRLKAQEKKIDYNERAKRLIEIPKYKDLFEKQREKDREFWENEEDKRIKRQVAEHRQNLEMSKRFNHMKADLQKFLSEQKSAKRSETEKKMNDFNARLEVEKKKRIQELKDQRKKERRDAYMKQKQEEEQRRYDEELKKEREIKEAEEARRLKKLEEDYLQHKEALDKQERMKRERELEIERKHEMAASAGGGKSAWRDREPASREPPSRADDSKEIWRPGGGAWQKKEQEKLDSWRKKDEGPVDAPATREVPPPSRRDLGSKDIRLEENFKEDQKKHELEREQDKARPGDDRFQRNDRPPRKDDDRFGTRRDDGDRFPRNDDGDRFQRPREGDRFGGPRRDDGERFGGPRRDNGGDRFGGPRRDDGGDRFGSRRDDGGDRFGSRRDDGGDRFGSRRDDGGDRFGSRRDDGGDRFGSRRDDGGDRFGSRRDDGGDRFGSRRDDGGDRFGSRRDDGDRFGARRDDRGDGFGGGFGGRGGGRWGEPRRGGRDGGPPARGGGAWDSDNRFPRDKDDGGSWRTSKASIPEPRNPPRMEEKRGGPPPRVAKDSWREGPPSNDGAPVRKEPLQRRDKPAHEPDADGWTTVRK